AFTQNSHGSACVIDHRQSADVMDDHQMHRIFDQRPRRYRDDIPLHDFTGYHDVSPAACGAKRSSRANIEDHAPFAADLIRMRLSTSWTPGQASARSSIACFIHRSGTVPSSVTLAAVTSTATSLESM